jgi:hypothetical protein
MSVLSLEVYTGDNISSGYKIIYIYVCIMVSLVARPGDPPWYYIVSTLPAPAHQGGLPLGPDIIASTYTATLESLAFF